MSFDAGAIIAKLELQKEQWNASIKSIQDDMKGAADKGEKEGKRITSIADVMTNKWVMGAAAVAASMVALVKKTADYGDELWKASQKTGIAVETLSGLKLAADKSDLSLGGLAMGMSRLSRLVVEANRGGLEQQAVLQRIGVTATDTTGRMKPMDALMGEVSDKFKFMPDGVEKTAMAIDIFGKSGMEMIPLLNLGSEGLKREREEAERLGLVMSGPTAQASEAFNDQLTTLKKSLLGVTVTVGTALMPVFQKIVEGVVDIVSGFNRWLKQNPEIVQSIHNIVESIRWLVTGIKDAIVWIGKLGEKLSGMAKMRAMAMQQMAAAEARYDAEQKAGHERWLARHNEILAKRKDTTQFFLDWWLTFNKGQEAKVTSNLAEEVAKRERLIEKQYDKFVKEAKDAFKKMMTYSDQEVKGERIDWGQRAVTAAQMSDKMKSYFVGAMTNMGIKGKKVTEDLKKDIGNWRDTVGKVVQVVQQGFSDFFGSLQQMSNNRYQKEFQAMDAEYQKRKLAIENSLMSETEKMAALEALDAEYADKKKALEIKQAEANKKSGISQAIVNTALAITSALTTKPFFPMGLIAAAVAAAAGAMQIAVIKSTPLPGLAKGGLQMEPATVNFAENGPEAAIPLPELKDMLGVGKSGRKQQSSVHNWYIKAMDGKDVLRVAREQIFPELKRAMMRESFTVPVGSVR
jgi:TP901 family phage tail tape measure protein